MIGKNSGHLAIYYLFLPILVYLALNPLAAQAQTPPVQEAQLLIPPAQDGPTAVTIDLIIRNIANIDEREETFEIDAELLAEWQDDRLAFDPELFGDTEKVYQGEIAQEKLKTEIWWPNLEITDSQGARERIALELRVWPDGHVLYAERFRVSVFQPFDLENFPFDEHVISLNVRPFSHTVDKVILVEPEQTRFELDWQTHEWEIIDEQIIIEPGALEDEEAIPYDGARVEITISRIPNFYISNFALPLLLIVAISWAVFWMNFDSMHLADRLSVSFTSVLTVVAFDFVMSDSLPRLPYATLLDRMLVVSYIFLGLTVLENVIGHTMVQKGKPAAAQTIDKICRWLFPLGYFFVLAAAIMWGIAANSG